MPIAIHRILAGIIPMQVASLIAFTIYATRPAAPTQLADRIVVSKSAHTLTLYAHGSVLHTYQVALGRRAGPKQQEGDHRTPEGHYIIDQHNAHSAFHLALHISYPNQADRARTLASHRPTGGDILIHGLPRGAGILGPLEHMVDWTDGCIAVSNAQIEEIYRLVPNNTPIDIQP